MCNLNNVIVTGANGILANEIKLNFSKKIKVFFYNKNKFNIRNYNQSYKICKIIKPKLIINTAAYTDTENSEQQKKDVNKTNVKGLENLIKISKLLDIKLIHFSSDYIFNGKKRKPYLETDKTKPLNYYGKSKLKGELLIKKHYYKNTMLFRTSLLYSEFNKNILKTIIYNLKKNNDINFMHDVICSPTSANSLAKFLNFILINNLFKYGIYNFCDSGYCSNYEYALYVKKLIDKKKLFKTKSIIYPIDQKDYKTKIIRPSFSALNTDKIFKNFNYRNNNWKKNVSLIIKNAIKKTINY